jgi:hypothetical protein
VDLERRDRRNYLIEEGEIIDTSIAAKKVGIQCKVAVTKNFFKHLYPYAEDATKGRTWEEILEDVFKVFKKEFGRSHTKHGEFAILAKTYVKEVHAHDKVTTFSDGKARDKRIVISVAFMPDETLQPSMIFAIKEVQWLGGKAKG